jgi:signal peptidase I
MNSSETEKFQEKEVSEKRKKISYIKFGIIAVLYALWVIWVGSWWLILGLGIIFDIYITKKVNWTPWKKRYQKNNAVVEWIDALIFAVLAVTFINVFFFQNYKIPTGSMEKSLLIGDFLYVSKVKYGPKIPNTPLSFPFTQHTLPLTKNTKSYLEWITLSYKRLKGFTTIKNDDNVVFNFPEGDTVVAVPIEMQAQSYYSIMRMYAEYDKAMDAQNGLPIKTEKQYLSNARTKIWNNPEYEMAIRPVDRRDNYIKRCVAIPGDTLTIIDGQLLINSKPQKHIDNVQFKYLVKTDGTPINRTTLDKMGIYPEDAESTGENGYIMILDEKNAKIIKSFINVKSIERIIKPKGYYLSNIFPHNPAYPWNEDNFGPLWMPKKGATIPINLTNLCIYERIINAYEGNALEVKDSTIYINGKAANSYTFKMDYYYMIGDNRHNSADSRFWGFVPEDHIVGAPRLIWLSLDKTKSFPANIRWKRLFKPAGRYLD